MRQQITPSINDLFERQTIIGKSRNDKIRRLTSGELRKRHFQNRRRHNARLPPRVSEIPPHLTKSLDAAIELNPRTGQEFLILQTASAVRRDHDALVIPRRQPRE